MAANNSHSAITIHRVIVGRENCIWKVPSGVMIHYPYFLICAVARRVLRSVESHGCDVGHHAVVGVVSTIVTVILLLLCDVNIPMRTRYEKPIYPTPYPG